MRLQRNPTHPSYQLYDNNTLRNPGESAHRDLACEWGWRRVTLDVIFSGQSLINCRAAVGSQETPQLARVHMHGI